MEDANDNRSDLGYDGFDDLLVGAYTFSNGQSLEGGVFLYYGSALFASVALMFWYVLRLFMSRR